MVESTTSNGLTTGTPEYRLFKFLTGAVIIGTMFTSLVGLMIVSELKALSSSRESGFVEIKSELSEIKNNHSREVSEWTIWRNQIDNRIRELTKDAVDDRKENP